MSVVVLPELIEMETPLGRGHAIVLETTAHDYFWTVVLATGALVTFPQNKVRAVRSYTHGRIGDAEMTKIVAGE